MMVVTSVSCSIWGCLGVGAYQIHATRSRYSRTVGDESGPSNDVTYSDRDISSDIQPLRALNMIPCSTPSMVEKSNDRSVIMMRLPVCVGALNRAVAAVAVAPEPLELGLVIGLPVSAGR